MLGRIFWKNSSWIKFSTSQSSLHRYALLFTGLFTTLSTGEREMWEAERAPSS
jgi:hypothetical protein